MHIGKKSSFYLTDAVGQSDLCIQVVRVVCTFPGNQTCDLGPCAATVEQK